MIRILGDLCPNRDLFCVLIMTHGDLASQELRLDHQPCDVYLIINIYIYTPIVLHIIDELRFRQCQATKLKNASQI